MRKFVSAILIGSSTIGMATGLYVFLMPHSGEASAALAPQANIPTVETIRPIRADMAKSFNTNASLEAFETTDLYPKVSGYLSEVRVDIGDHVKSGQVLALISLPETEKELAQAEATVTSKRANLALSQTTLKRQEGLLRIQGTPQQTYDEAKAAVSVAAADVDLAVATADQIRTTLAYAKIVAPFDGVVARRWVNRGDFMQSASTGRTTPMFTVQRVDTIRIFCNVPESDVAHLRVGLPATITPYGWEGKSISGKVSRFEGRLDPQTRNMRTEIDLPNPGGRMYPGMYAQVSLETELHPKALTLPAPAIGTDTKGKFVYGVQQGRIVRLPVQVGMTEGGMAEILSGLSDTSDVVASVQGAPSPATAVKAAPRT
jgi:RND family efflux transporter MFP subunit